MSQVTVDQALQLAIGHCQAGRLRDAESICRQILAAQPNHAESLALLGVMAGRIGRHDLGADLIRKAIAAAPGYAGYYCELGILLASAGQVDQAISCYQQALAISSDFAQAHHSLGNAHMMLGQLDAAISCYQRALALVPRLVESRTGLANALKDAGRLDEAIDSYHQALQIKRDFPHAHNGLGNALRQKGQPDAAISCFRQALAISPDFPEAHNNLGNALKDVSWLDEAVTAFRRAIELRPDYSGAHSNLLNTLHFRPAADAPGLYAEARQWNTRHALPLQRLIRPHANDRDANRPLRIGYVSADFCEHASALFLMPLFRHHDRRQFDVTCYAQSAQAGGVTQQMQEHVQHWRKIAGRTDAEVAAMVRQDGIDILVDLSMHTRGNRLLVFAQKPAPVQVTWLAYAGTTGLDAIDYRLTDPHLDPPGIDDSHYSEASIRLPHTFWCYDPLTSEPAVNELAATRNGFVTFGCLNNYCKVNEGVLASWAGILNAVADSRLMLLAPHGGARRRVADRLAAGGIGGERVEFIDHQSRRDYLRTYHRMDIALDPFPYGGGTTTCDAAWMGVPTVTLRGRTAVGRGGISILSTLDLVDWVADSAEQYRSIATEMAGDLPMLAELRGLLRGRMEASVLMDGPRFARDMEAAYRTMWRTWCEKSS